MMRKSLGVTRSVETRPIPTWALEIERVDANPKSEYYSVVALQCGPKGIQFMTPSGTQVTIKLDDIKKILVMKIVDGTQTQL